MHLQLVNPEPDQTPDVTPPAAPEPEASAVQPLTRAEWRDIIAARCTERNITLNRACAEIGITGNYFSPSNIALGVPAAVAARLHDWLDGMLPADNAAPTRQPKPAPEAPVALKYEYTGPVPFVPDYVPPRPARRYPAITVEPSAMPLDDLVEYLARLRDLMPGATVTWPTAITVGMES